MVVVAERTRHVRMGVVLHSIHCAVGMRKEGICWRGRLLSMVGGTKYGMVRRAGPWGIVHLSGVLVCRHLLGNARGLLWVVHGIEGEQSQYSLRWRCDAERPRTRTSSSEGWQIGVLCGKNEADPALGRGIWAEEREEKRVETTNRRALRRSEVVVAVGNDEEGGLVAVQGDEGAKDKSGGPLLTNSPD